MTWQTWMIVLAWVFSKAAITYAFCEPLERKYKMKYIVLSYVTSSVLIYFVRIFFFVYMPVAIFDAIFFVFIAPLQSYIILRIACRDKNIKIALIMTLVYTLGVLGHILMFILWYSFSDRNLAFNFVSTESVYGAYIAAFLEILFYTVFIFVWRRYVGKIHSDIPNAGAFIFVIGGQLIYNMYNMLRLIPQQAGVDPLEIIGTVFMIIGNFVIIQILFTNSKKKELEDNLNEIQHIRELEHMHYTAIEERRQEMAKIRHDFNNQLLAAHQLISSDKWQHAELILDELEASISKTSEYAYCQNAIVNAVLTEKQKECDDAKIMLETDIAINEECKISPLHLCSVFTNILDNAIRACKLLPHGQRKIELRTAIKGDYIHIKCVNPIAGRQERARNGKGYGKIILSDIAGHYGGNFTAERIDKTHVALISLLHSAT